MSPVSIEFLAVTEMRPNSSLELDDIPTPHAPDR
jgi:hypothetical protein